MAAMEVWLYRAELAPGLGQPPGEEKPLGPKSPPPAPTKAPTPAAASKGLGKAGAEAADGTPPKPHATTAAVAAGAVTTEGVGDRCGMAVETELGGAEAVVVEEGAEAEAAVAGKETVGVVLDDPEGPEEEEEGAVGLVAEVVAEELSPFLGPPPPPLPRCCCCCCWLGELEGGWRPALPLTLCP